MKNIIIIIALTILGLNAGFANVDPDNKPAKFRILAISASNDSIMSASNIITLFQPFSVEFPTAFTPNGDGLNDSFGAVAKGVEDYKLIIYNRFGDVIFTSTDIEKKWDGKIQGDSAPSGAYVYQVYAEGQEGTSVNRSGKVTLIK
ncbi:gliding motility-associated C-terminal domain-containing protein [Marivirga salinae]|uniref:Gliding motility-associated C-terminal domain-containing protein n=1 Tax=Marivirga salinarum TaxID=3059078 RepID=A0AA49GB51_9BACT|nr:gliding motility-associated C-terminal domain-containing protein [Marivirga sp. BDSF4-3]WKK78296.2 gliding motility-associated C-terminal domain-containing protein [Marivirga sp. BDSF4-3]